MRQGGLIGALLLRWEALNEEGLACASGCHVANRPEPSRLATQVKAPTATPAVRKLAV